MAGVSGWHGRSGDGRGLSGWTFDCGASAAAVAQLMGDGSGCLQRPGGGKEACRCLANGASPAVATGADGAAAAGRSCWAERQAGHGTARLFPVASVAAADISMTACRGVWSRERCSARGKARGWVCIAPAVLQYGVQLAVALGSDAWQQQQRRQQPAGAAAYGLSAAAGRVASAGAYPA